MPPKGRIVVNETLCKGCTLCEDACPQDVIGMAQERLNAKGYHPAEMLAEKRGIEVIGGAENAVEAFLSIRDKNPDVVILDIHLPAMGGMDVLRKIMEQNLPCKVMVLADTSLVQYRDRCLKKGAHVVLEKSTEFQKIPDALVEMMARRLEVTMRKQEKGKGLEGGSTLHNGGRPLSRRCLKRKNRREESNGGIN